MARIIQALPPMFAASISGFEDMNKILLAQKLVVVHILDTTQQGLSQEAPEQERVREETGEKKAAFTSNLWAQAALEFRKEGSTENARFPQAVDGQVKLQNRPLSQIEEEQPNTKSLSSKPGPIMTGVNKPEISSTKKRKRPEGIELPSKRRKWSMGSPPRTPENKYRWPCDWFHTMGSTESGQSSASNLADDASSSSNSAPRHARKRRRRDYLQTRENGNVTYRKFSPITFDIFEDRESASTPSVAGSESDETGFVYDSSDSYDGFAAWEASPPNDLQGNTGKIPAEESLGIYNNQGDVLDESWKPFHGNVDDSYSRDTLGVFHEPLRGLAILRGKNNPSRVTLDALPDFERDLEFGRRARANVLEADQQRRTAGEEMDAAMAIIDRAFAKAEKTRIEKRPQSPKSNCGTYSSSTRTSTTTDPGQIVGKDGRPSRLMPPSTVAHFKEEEERAKWAAEVQLVYDQGVFVRGRRGETPTLQHPRPQRLLSVVEDFEAWMRGER